MFRERPVRKSHLTNAVVRHGRKVAQDLIAPRRQPRAWATRLLMEPRGRSLPGRPAPFLCARHEIPAAAAATQNPERRKPRLRRGFLKGLLSSALASRIVHSITRRHFGYTAWCSLLMSRGVLRCARAIFSALRRWLVFHPIAR
jgi:hypothetical protein